MKNRYYNLTERGQAVFRGDNPPSHLIKDDDARVKNFFEPTPDGYKKAYTAEGLPFNELIPPAPDKTAEQLTAEYKGYYLEVISNKLKELDYDSIEMLEIWLDDPTFGTQAQSIKDWYKSVINKNYQILNAVKNQERTIPTKEQYLSELPIYNG